MINLYIVEWPVKQRLHLGGLKKILSEFSARLT